MSESKSSLTPEETNRIKQSFDIENKQLFEGLVNPTKSIYLDMEFIQDFRLGALMQLITTDVEYEYILSKINEYNNSEMPITAVFSALKLTEDQIDSYIADKNNADILALESPFLTNLTLFRDFIVDVMVMNSLKKYEGDVDIFIGCATFQYPQVAQIEFIEMFKGLFDKVNLIFLPATLYEFQGRMVDDYDVYLIQYASKLINHPALVKRFEAMEMTSKIIVGVAENKATEEDLKAYSTTKEEAIKATIEFANVFTHFAFAEHVIQV